ncbi:SCO4402 family protein [Nonomuraea rubra]|uniref:SCO4402 family protein n=1 Tax=Nonomuraea rubra TaxID=46180 RepID=UPI0033F5F9DD
MESSAKETRFPEMRAEIISAVSALADPAYQERVWLRRIYPHPQYYDDFDLNIHILYDDTTVLENPQRAIGNLLVSQQEADALAMLAKALQKLFDAEGISRSDQEYMNSPCWREVVEAARQAKQAMVDSAADE